MHPVLRVFAPALLALSALTAGATGPAERLVTEGDPERGIDPCANCHHANGGGSEEVGAPRLAALGAAYLIQQIENFRNGNRRHPIMQPWAELLTGDEITAVSHYYAALPPVSNAQVPNGIDPAAGAWLVLYGDWPERRLPGCVQCHGPLGVGVGQHFPALAGQPYNYLIGQLAAWTSGTRKGDPLGMMGAINAKLSEAESQAVAAFYAALPAVKAEDAAAKIDSGNLVPDAATMQALEHSGAAAQMIDTKGHRGLLPHHGPVPDGRAPPSAGHFRPPARDAKPKDQLGAVVTLGEAIFSHTNSHELSGKYVGNVQVCEGCHLDAGRLADAAPMWAAWVAYPAYRGKNKRVNTLVERIQGCFKYSMNAQASAVGHPPAADSRTIEALVSYLYWLATGAPTGDTTMAGRGYPRLAEPEQGFDPERGRIVYAEQCAICHGADGAGGYASTAAGQAMVFPPLWGEQSYNWGAGMHRIDTAAAFIKANMPLGNFLELTDQQAWDVAAYMNSQQRPQDPRFTGDLAETTAQFHDNKFDYYGKRQRPDGKLLGDASPE